MLQTSKGRFRAVGFAEAISFLVLLGIAMPLKYYAGYPDAVTWVGALHGALFTLYLFALANVWIEHRWSIGKALLGFIAAVLPFGYFLFDRLLWRS